MVLSKNISLYYWSFLIFFYIFFSWIKLCFSSTFSLYLTFLFHKIKCCICNVVAIALMWVAFNTVGGSRCCGGHKLSKVIRKKNIHSDTQNNVHCLSIIFVFLNNGYFFSFPEPLKNLTVHKQSEGDKILLITVYITPIKYGQGHQQILSHCPT